MSGRARAEVAGKLRRLQRDLDDGVSADGRQTTVAALCEDWLRQSSGQLSRNTVDLRTWALRQHLVPALGARRVRELSADDVARFLQDKAAAGYSRASLDKMRGCSSRSSRTRSAKGWSCATSLTSSIYRPRTTPTVEAAVTTMDRLFDRPEDV